MHPVADTLKGEQPLPQLLSEDPVAPAPQPLPGLCHRYVIVSLPDGLPENREGPVEPILVERLVIPRRGLSDPVRTMASLASLVAQVGDAADQIAEPVCKIGLVQLLKALQRKVAVLEGWHRSQQMVAHRVGAIASHTGERIQQIANRLAELLAVHGFETVNQEQVMQRQPRDSRKAGQYTAWNFHTSLPRTWIFNASSFQNSPHSSFPP